MIVDQLLGDQGQALPFRMEQFAHRQRRGRVLPDQAETLFVFGAQGVFQKEQMVRFQFAGQPRGLNGRQPLMDIMEQFDLVAEFVAQMREQFGDRRADRARAPTFPRAASARRRPRIVCCRLLFRLLLLPPLQAAFPVRATRLRRPVRRGRGVRGRAVAARPGRGGGFFRAAHAIRADVAGNGDLRPDHLEALLHPFADAVFGFDEIAPARMGVGQRALARLAAEQRVDRQSGAFAFDVPERDVDTRQRGHQDRPAAPVRAPKQHLPDVFDAVGVAPDQQGRDMLGKRGGDGQFAPVQRGVSHAVQAGFVGQDFHDDVVAGGAGDDHAYFGYSHRRDLLKWICRVRACA